MRYNVDMCPQAVSHGGTHLYVDLAGYYYSLRASIYRGIIDYLRIEVLFLKVTVFYNIFVVLVEYHNYIFKS